MKKFSRIFVIIFTLFMCGVFSACKDDYSDLEMNFYSNNGDAISSVRLVVDEDPDDDINLSCETIRVKLDGIKASEVGDVNIQVPSFVVLSDVQIGTTCSFKITAVSHNKGYIKVTHEESGKSKQIEIEVEQKSNNLKAKRGSEIYAVAIPSSGSKQTKLNANIMADLYPTDSSDNVYFKLKRDVNWESKHITPTTVEIGNETLIDGFVLTEESVECDDIEVVPVTTMLGFPNTTYENVSFNIKFVKGLPVNKIKLETDELHEDSVDDVIYLISNDYSAVTIDSWLYQYNNVQFKIKIDENYFEDTGFFENYVINCETTNNAIFADYTADNKVVVQANDITANTVDVKIILSAKNVGDIEPVELKLKVKGEAKPTSINVYKDGVEIEKLASGALPNVNLFDYYNEGTPNAYGSRFTFVPVVEESYEDLRVMRIQLLPSLLNTSVNTVYTDAGFSDELTDEIGTSENLYLLEFRFAERIDEHTIDKYGTNKLKFFYDGEKLVSERIYSTDVIYVQYKEVSTNSGSDPLSIDIKTFYDGDLGYIDGIECANIQVAFDRQDGVKSSQFDIGTLEKEDNTYKLSSRFSNVDTLYLSREDGINIEEDETLDDYGKDVYVVNMANLLGDGNKRIGSAKFNISITGGKEHPIYLFQPDFNVLNEIKYSDLIKTDVYNYRNSANIASPDNSLIIVYDNTTDLGEYTIVFTNENGYTCSLDCFVYSSIQPEDIKYTTTGLDGKYCFNNKILVGKDESGADVYTTKFADYECDYIVAKGKSLQFDIKIDDRFTINNYVKSYEFKVYLGTNELPLNNEYLTAVAEGKKLKITFNKGTFVDEIKYITLQIIAVVQGYNNIIEFGQDVRVVLEKNFFVYEVLDDVVLMQDSNKSGELVNVYMYDLLGCYYKDKAKVDLHVEISSYMLNYIQTAKQAASYNIGYTKLASDAEYNEEIDYYRLIGQKYFVKELYVTEISDNWLFYKYENDALMPINNPNETAGNLYALINGEYCLIKLVDDGKTIEEVRSENFDDNKNQYYVNAKQSETNVVWILNTGNDANTYNFTTISQSDTSISFYCGVNASITKYSVEIIAKIKQFNLEHTKKSIITVAKPVISDYVQIENSLKENEETGERYIALRSGSKYTLKASAYLKDGTMARSELMLIVVNAAGYNVTNSNYVTIVSDGYSFDINAVTPFSPLKLYVVAKDALAVEILQNAGGYNNFEDFLLENHNKAFVEIVLMYTDGSEANPYTVFDASDFWKINLSEADKKAHYVLMNNINLAVQDVNKYPINEFSGSIKSYGNRQYVLYNVELNNNFVNLFERINNTAKFENIKFIVNYAYDNYGNTSSKLGVIGENVGLLKNVSVEVKGSATRTKGYFGGLVGVNINGGLILYDNSTTGVSGNIVIDATCSVNFGGLVGNNSGEVQGNRDSVTTNSSGVSINVYVGDEGAMSCLNIVSKQTSGCVGGIIGYNTGKLSYAFVSAKIEGYTSVGGAIGYNLNEKHVTSVAVNSGNLNNLSVDDNAQISFVTSAAKITGKSDVVGSNNLGGIVGLDINGYYANCKYQLIKSYQSQIVGTNNIGGIAGSSENGYFKYCSVYDYNSGNTISGKNYVAGIVGCAKSSLTGEDNKRFTDNTIPDGTNPINAVALANCSANVNLVLEDGGNHIAGLLCDSAEVDYVYSLIVYAYYIGDISGATSEYVINNIADGRYAFTNYIYFISNKGNGEKGISNTIVSDGIWACKSDINNGKSYLIYKDDSDNVKPIFDIAPSSITVEIPTDANYQHKENLLPGYSDIINLYYYTYNGVSSKDANYKEIAERLIKKNTYSLNFVPTNTDGLFKISVEPTDITARLIAYSNDNSVVKIDGKNLIVVGVGQTTVVFESVLNGTQTVIVVNVERPFGKNIELWADKNDSSTNLKYSSETSPVGVSKDTGKIYYEVFENANDVGSMFEDYSFTSNSEINYEVTATAYYQEINAYIADKEYYSFNGTNYVLEDAVTAENFNTYSQLYLKININEVINFSNFNAINDVFEVLDGKPFVINVLKNIEDVVFEFNIKPYIIVVHNGTNVKKYSNNPNDTYKFYVRTAKGVTGLNLNYNSLVVYPIDETVLTLTATTDLKVKAEDVAIYGVAKCYNGNSLVATRNINSTNYYRFINNERTGLLSGNQQTLTYKLKNENMFGTMPSYNYDKMVVTLTFSANGIETSINITMLREKIASIDIVNYIYEVIESKDEIVVSDVLKPDSDGLLIIKTVPDVAYYDYLEIVDETGSEEITFIQINSKDKTNYGDKWSEPAHYGKGIKLFKDVSVDNNIYVRTLISKDFSTKLHKIVVYAFINGDDQPIAKFDKTIDVRMMPTVVIRDIKPDDSLQTSGELNQYFAAEGVDIRFKADTKNSDGNQDVSITMVDALNNAKQWSDYYALEENNGFYTLRAKDINYVVNKTQGCKLSVTISTTATYSHGDYEVGSTTIIYNIKPFVVYGASIIGKSIKNGSDLFIYGNYGETVDLNFYFSATDISYRDGNVFWVNEYTENSTVNEDIKTILNKLNKESENYQSVKFSFTDENGKELTSDNILKNNKNEVVAKLLGNKLIVDGDVDGAYLMIKYDDAEHHERSFVTLFRLKFGEASSYLEPQAVLSVDDFLNMQSGENNYILGCDLTLYNYKPLKVNLQSFDGNGHTITINSFAPFEEADIKAGLFAEIPQGMVVTNTKVVYPIRTFAGQIYTNNSEICVDRYYDFCNSPDVDYTSLTFGGLTATNNGIISNCSVSGFMAVIASAVENKVANYSIATYIGSLVGDNGTTGYITNSFSGLKIIGQANIAGLVYSNAGKIATSFFNAKDGLIYAYNNTTTKQYAIKVGGFVVDNSGEISMCYVESGETNLSNGAKIGNLSAKDESAGFVYKNTGTIYDSYVNVNRVGYNNNTFSGFVNENTGEVYNCYTRINGSNVNMFAPKGTNGVSSCYEIRLGDSSIIYNNGISGLTTLLAGEALVQKYYKGFAFGAISEKKDAVWMMDTYPKLIATDEVVSRDLIGDSDAEYTGLRNLKKKAYRYDANNNLVEMAIEDVPSYTGEVIYKYVITDKSKANYGSRNNPILIYSIDMWNYYLAENDTIGKYYRLITDLDYSTIKENPQTSTKVFRGNLQGNNMDIKDVTIYSSNSLTSIGLFKELQGANNIEIYNSVRNLDISVSSIQATETKAVGGLAGIVQDFNVYNVDVEGKNVVAVGKNAVGGVVGLVRGKFDIDGITSDVGVQSVYPSYGSNYDIYVSKNNKESVSYNLNNVSYAGCLIGVLDGYFNGEFNINNERSLPTNYETGSYSYVQNASVNGSVVAMADTVGVLFGFVGERVWVNNANVVLSGGELIGVQYTSGMVGENRGVVNNATVLIEDASLFNSSNVSAGIVGLNLGGIVINSYSNVVISSTIATVGGIVGRNINGAVKECKFAGKILGHFTGGIIGANFTKKMLTDASNEPGALRADLLDLQKSNVIPNAIPYKNITQELTNVAIEKVSLDYWLDELNYFYVYGTDKSNNHILGLFIGASDKSITLTTDNIGYNTDKDVVLNGVGNISPIVGTVEQAQVAENRFVPLISKNYYFIKGYAQDNTAVAYVVGTVVTTFNVWQNNYDVNSTLVFINGTDEIIPFEATE